ncbi:MAG TPA: multicopper oxidase domain-containing protein, partial [Mycobacterium sp.]|nr:multicopper oxidase domain-containing protein [Mycobacterium sp.]
AAIAVVALWPSRKPREVASWNLAAALAWLVIAVLVEVAGALWARSVDVLPGLIEAGIMPMLTVGFVAQILIGALTQMLPVVMAQGPAERKAVAGYLDQGWQARLAALNIAVLLVAAPWPGQVRMIGWALAAIGVAGFLWLALRLAIPAVLRRRMNVEAIEKRLPGTMTGVVAGLTAVAVAVAVAVGPPQSHEETTVSGEAQIMDVALRDMRVWPDTVEVPAGTRLVLRVTNEESLPHDLRVENGEHTPRLRRGQTAMLDVGVVQHDLDVWCDVPGHKAAGMTMSILTLGGEHKPVDAHSGHHVDASRPVSEPVSALNLAADPSSGWTPRDPALAAAPPGPHRVELRAVDKELEVAPGRRETRWTFGGTEPAPVLHGRVGDQFEITLINDTTMGHGIDFHAGALSPDRPMRTLEPGERLIYRFTANRAGAWLYHCSTDPISLHIANGMYGAVIIDPPGLPHVDHEFALVGAQLYLGDPESDDKPAAIRADRPDGWMFNGMADQYKHAPLQVRAGERVRIWLVNAGPGDNVAFHIVGTQFDTVYKEGAWLLRPGAANAPSGGSQVLDLAPAQGGFVELTFPEPGNYMIMDHDLRQAEGGARGMVSVAK